MPAIPLWNEDARAALPSLPLAADPVAFSCMGRGFVYDPDDMRLYAAADPGAVLAARLRAGETTTRPQFALPDTPPRTVVLVPTRACNLRCRYCFAAPEHAVDGLLSLEDALAAVSLIPEEEEAAIGFFGGEALLAFERVREIVEEAIRRRRRPPRFSLTTNGLLLDGEALDFLERHGFSLIVSLDGPPELHDASRPDAAGRGSYARVAAALERLAARPRLASRVTLRGTYDGRAPALVTRLAHLNELARRGGFANVSVEPADLSESCARPARAADDASAKAPAAARPVVPSEELAEEYYEAARWYATEAKAGRRPLFHHFSVRLERLRRRRPAPAECGAGVGYLTAAPDGILYACHRLGDSAVGTIRHGIDRARQAEWRDNRYYQREGCAACWRRNVCGAGCRLTSREKCGDWRRPDPLGCWLTDICLRCAAWIMAETDNAQCAMRNEPHMRANGE